VGGPGAKAALQNAKSGERDPGVLDAIAVGSQM
jgi:hypothetical protein